MTAINVNQRNILVVILLIMGLGMAVYANVINGPFLWDDHLLVADNADIRDWRHLEKIFSSNIGGESLEAKSSSYRPLQTFSYLIDYCFWELNPAGYRLTNIILHIFVAVSLFWLLSLMGLAVRLSGLTAVLFVVHPLHAGVVSYISGRADLLAALFMLLALVSYLKDRPVFMSFCFCLALLSKETALILPVFIWLYNGTINRKTPLKASKGISILGLLSALYVILRLTGALGSLYFYDPERTTAFQRLPGFFAAFFNYIRLIILPFGLHMEYGRKLFGFNDPQVLAGFGLFFLLVVMAVRIKEKDPIISFSLGWFIVGLIPVSNIFVNLNAYMAEHWLYIPSMGFFLFINRDGPYLFELNRARPYLLSVITALYVGLTIFNNRYWRDPGAFFTRTLSYAPKSVRAHLELAKLLTREGNIDLAIIAYNMAGQLDPLNGKIHGAIGLMHYKKGDVDRAITHYQKANELTEGLVENYMNLGRALRDKKEFVQSRQAFERALAFNPSHVSALNDVGVEYARDGEYTKAEYYFLKALELDENNGLARANLKQLNHIRDSRIQGQTP